MAVFQILFTHKEQALGLQPDRQIMHLLIHIVFGEHELIEQPPIVTAGFMLKVTHGFVVHDES